jgi:chromosome segregation ATPase
MAPLPRILSLGLPDIVEAELSRLNQENASHHIDALNPKKPIIHSALYSSSSPNSRRRPFLLKLKVASNLTTSVNNLSSGLRNQIQQICTISARETKQDPIDITSNSPNQCVKMDTSIQAEDNVKKILDDNPKIKEKLNSLLQTNIEVLQDHQSEFLKGKDDKIRALKQQLAQLEDSKNKEIIKLSTSLKIAQTSDRYLRELNQYKTDLMESEKRKRTFLESEVTELRENIKELTGTKRQLSNQILSLGEELTTANNDIQRHKGMNEWLIQQNSSSCTAFNNLQSEASIAKGKLEEVANLKRNQEEMTSEFAAFTRKWGSEGAGSAKRTRRK